MGSGAVIPGAVKLENALVAPGIPHLEWPKVFLAVVLDGVIPRMHGKRQEKPALLQHKRINPQAHFSLSFDCGDGQIVDLGIRPENVKAVSGLYVETEDRPFNAFFRAITDLHGHCASRGKRRSLVPVFIEEPNRPQFDFAGAVFLHVESSNPHHVFL